MPTTMAVVAATTGQALRSGVLPTVQALDLGRASERFATDIHRLEVSLPVIGLGLGLGL
jgi:hypothetical protein